MKNLLALLILFVCMASGNAQISLQPDSVVQQSTASKPKPSFRERSYFGGNIGLSFGDYTLIGIYPLYGYKINPKLSVGTMVSYEYVNDKRYDPDFTSTTYGGSLFTRYRFIPQIYGHVEYAQMNYELYNAIGETDRVWVPFLYVGGGVSQPIGGNSWFNMQVLFDVIQDKNSPYKAGEPVFSVGFGIGF